MYSCRCRFMSLFAVASSICAGGDSPSHRKKTTEEENFSTGLRRVSDLYLVNGLLVFLLSRLEEALGVVNHLLQAVLLIDGRRNNRLEVRTLCLNANNSHTAGQLMELSESRLVLFSHPVRISLTGAALLALADGTEPHTHTHGQQTTTNTPTHWKQTRGTRGVFKNHPGKQSLPLQEGGWGRGEECNLESPPKGAASPQSPPRLSCHSRPRTHTPS